MKTLLLSLLLLSLLCLIQFSNAAECHGAPSPNAQPNMNPIDTRAPVLLKSISNGKLYQVGSGDDLVHVVHLWGSSYEKGFAHGTLMRDAARSMLNATWTYFEDQVIQAINGTGHALGFSQAAIDLVAEVGLEAALDLTYDATKAFTGSYFYEEMKGLSDASGVDYDTIRRIHMIGELTKGSCSMFGAWGGATQSINGRLLQLRALDWAVDGPFRNYPQITVYHTQPNSPDGYSFANIGWTGWIGSISGVSSNQLGISEIGVAFPDDTFGAESRIGIPFTNILRDVLQFDKTLDDALHRMTTANRTCDLILGVGDAKSASFRGIEYSYSVANFYDDTNMQPTATWHPKISNVVYYGMDWLCPGYNSVLARQLNTYHGNITAENTIRDITSIVQTGDLLVAIYDLSQWQLYVANARGDSESGPDYAYDRQFIQLDMKSIFDEPAPTLAIA